MLFFYKIHIIFRSYVEMVILWKFWQKISRFLIKLTKELIHVFNRSRPVSRGIPSNGFISLIFVSGLNRFTSFAIYSRVSIKQMKQSHFNVKFSIKTVLMILRMQENFQLKWIYISQHIQFSKGSKLMRSANGWNFTTKFIILIF